MTEPLPGRRVLALGGGGFTSAIEDWPLDEFALTLARRARPRICLLPTASGDPEEQIDRFYRTFEQHGCDLSHISLFRLGSHGIDLRGHLLSRDVIYVGGGSLKNMLALWRVHEVDSLLCEAWQQGIALAGVSAGAMCWFEAGVTRTHGTPVTAGGLGLLPGSISVHHGSDPGRRAAYLAAIARGMPAGYAVDDGVGLVFHGHKLVEAVTARPQARAFRVEREGDRIVERPLAARLLAEPGAPPSALRAEPVSISEYRALAQRRSSASRNSLRSIPPV